MDSDPVKLCRSRSRTRSWPCALAARAARFLILFGAAAVGLVSSVGCRTDACSASTALAACPVPFMVFIQADDGVFESGTWGLRLDVDGDVVEGSCDPTAGARCSLSGEGFGMSFAGDEASIVARNAAYPEDQWVQILPETVSLVLTPPDGKPLRRDWSFEPDHAAARACTNCQSHREDLILLSEFIREGGTQP